MSKDKLKPVSYLPIGHVIGVTPVPETWEIVSKTVVETPNNTGVLVRNKRTGIYRLFAIGCLSSVDQRAAEEFLAEERKLQEKSE